MVRNKICKYFVTFRFAGVLKTTCIAFQKCQIEVIMTNLDRVNSSSKMLFFEFLQNNFYEQKSPATL